MSEENDNSEVAEMAKEVEQMLKGFEQKYPGKIQDMALVVNWTQAVHQEGKYPKLFVETARDTLAPSFSPVAQTVELSDLLALGSNQMIKQLVNAILGANSQLVQQIQVMQHNQQQTAKPALKLIVPGQ